MSPNTDIERQKTEVRRKDAFARWLAEPMVRMGLSTIPKGDHEEGLKLLLQSAFEAGFGAGQGDVAISLIDVMIRRDMKKEG